MIGQQGSLGVSPAELLAAKNMASGKSDMNKEISLGGDLTRLMLAAMQLKKTQAELEKLKLTQGANPQTTVAQDVQQGIARLQGQGQQSEEQPQGQPQGQPPQQMAQMDTGIGGLPAGAMDDEGAFAGGGIVAFAEAGAVEGKKETQKDKFIREMMPAATLAAKELETTPQAVLSMWALETGWGAPKAVQGQNNYGNIQYQTGPNPERGILGSTSGTDAGRKRPFVNYDSPESFARDFVRNIKNPALYPGLKSGPKTANEFLSQIPQYAEDKQYRTKVMGLHNSSFGVTEAPTVAPTEAPLVAPTAPQDTAQQVNPYAVGAAAAGAATGAATLPPVKTGIASVPNVPAGPPAGSASGISAAPANTAVPAGPVEGRSPYVEGTPQERAARFRAAESARAASAGAPPAGAPPAGAPPAGAPPAGTPSLFSRGLGALRRFVVSPYTTGAGLALHSSEAGAGSDIVPGKPAGRPPTPKEIEGLLESGKITDVQAREMSKKLPVAPATPSKGPITDREIDGKKYDQRNAPATENAPKPKSFSDENFLTDEIKSIIDARKNQVPVTREDGLKQWKSERDMFGLKDEFGKEQVDRLASLAGQAKQDRDVGLWMAAATGFFAMGAGKSPYALQNFAAGAGIGIEQANSALGAYSKRQTELNQAQFEVEKARRAEKRGDFESYQTHMERAEKRQQDADDRYLNRLTSFFGIKQRGQEIKENRLSREYTQRRDFERKQLDDFRDALNKDPEYSSAKKAFEGLDQMAILYKDKPAEFAAETRKIQERMKQAEARVKSGYPALGGNSGGAKFLGYE